MPEATTRQPKAANLSWFKYNPAELLGRYDQLTDAEYGLFHRIIAKLWNTPGNRLSQQDLMQGLRIRPGDERDGLLSGLIGYALVLDEADLLHVDALDAAFADAVARTEAGKAGAQGRWKDKKPSEASTSEGDF